MQTVKDKEYKKLFFTFITNIGFRANTNKTLITTYYLTCFLRYN